MITLLPTPIGNLKDISFRTLEALAKSEVVLCEDTRVTKKLLTLLQRDSIITQNFPKIFEEKVFFSFHSHNQEEFLRKQDKSFFARDVVFLSDAGMPCISDPGALLVKYAQENNIAYDVLPGSNACLLAYCMSGNIDDGFIFGGFLPHKQQDRRKCLQDFFYSQSFLQKKLSIIFYESPHRILEALKDIVFVDSQCEVFAIKEMSKKNQKFFYSTAIEVLEKLQTENLKGEWVLILKSKRQNDYKSLSFEDISNMEIPPKIKAKLLAKMSNQDVKKIYESLIKG
ncbi:MULTISPECIES: 16S rRNA (cytidine(1402)-2'-O)-methyltransferase [unclassified Helicobacter]|uniref:16S rRNA (cytidine(1402)-2'-O)-methyltransferase n=1 Tax=unclassified Helicobacter TaxID=2593540 RepID=UPI0013151CE5|nr:MULTISPECIES: 16S rRNA (cytidine(1402)-2'-O)-methyltransferase [unclassified Helicobacter]